MKQFQRAKTLKDPSSVTVTKGILAISTTDKPVNRSILAYALTQLKVFALRGFMFRDIHKKTKKEIERFGL